MIITSHSLWIKVYMSTPPMRSSFFTVHFLMNHMVAITKQHKHSYHGVESDGFRGIWSPPFGSYSSESVIPVFWACTIRNQHSISAYVPYTILSCSCVEAGYYYSPLMHIGTKSSDKSHRQRWSCSSDRYQGMPETTRRHVSRCYIRGGTEGDYTDHWLDT